MSLPSNIQFLPCTTGDGDQLADLRRDAMRPSLEAIGRFDSTRVRTRFLEGFISEDTWQIRDDNQLAGFFVLRSKEDHLYLDHLYIAPDCQGRGIGNVVMKVVKAKATLKCQPIRLRSLKIGPSNGFYQSQGFRITSSDDLDNWYEWLPEGLQ
ncbi:GNAT family N-acetyltransferase [Roseibium algae]|uniref:GNAT family N-acetyltransferase n=1 Tax=Roseibium algae TaxID=3123038 RepID=A0ABU8TH25_9HYPH